MVRSEVTSSARHQTASESCDGTSRAMPGAMSIEERTAEHDRRLDLLVEDQQRRNLVERLARNHPDTNTAQIEATLDSPPHNITSSEDRERLW